MSNQQNSLGPLQQDEAYELSFRLRLPTPARPKACVVLLHGVGSSETSLADLAMSIHPDTLVVFPRGPVQFAPGQFGWFHVAFTPGGPSIDATEANGSRLSLVRFLEQLQSAYGVAPQDTVIAGFSQGGILSASVALSEPEHVAGFAVLSGRILPELEAHFASTQRLAHLRGFIAHGEYDSKLPKAWAQRADQWLEKLGVARATHFYPIDHGISAEMQTDFLDWLEQ